MKNLIKKLANQLIIKSSIITLTNLLISTSAFSQAVGVGESYFDVDASAVFEVKSTQKGILIPRLTQTERDSICIGGAECHGYNPAEGLMLYVKYDAGDRCIEIYVDSAWKQIWCKND